MSAASVGRQACGSASGLAPYGIGSAGAGERDVEHVVVVGASLAGLRACETLRTEGFAGRITLIGAETHLPYDRPPLSKKLLAGDWEPDRIALRQPDAIDALGLELRLGVPASSLDLDGRAVELADGDGGAVRRPRAGHRVAAPPAPRPAGAGERPRAAHARRRPRTAGRDRRRHRPRRRHRRRVHRARGGRHGARQGLRRSPCSRACRRRSCVASARRWARRRPPPTPTTGVDIRCDVAVAELRADGVVLGDGTAVPADVVVVGIGVAPATGWLDGSGLELRDGVVCDAALAAGPPLVYAAGDIARWTNELLRRGDAHRALDQRRRAGCRRGPQPARRGRRRHDRAPTHRCRSSGATRPATASSSSAGRRSAATTTRSRWPSGDPAEHRFLALYGRRGRLWGVLGVNCPRLVMPYRKLLADAVSWDDARAFAASQREAQQS